jgi:ATP-dependent Clp protease protease subunit
MMPAKKKSTTEALEFYLTYGLDIKSRTVFLEGEIDEDSVALIIRGITAMLQDNSEKPIKMFINSGGGSIYEGFALYDFLEQLPCELHTINYGKAMSMALIIYLVGDVRISTPRATFMNHSSSGAAGGKIADMKNDVKEIDRLENLCYDILAEKTNHTKQWWAKASKYEDCYYDKKQAKKLGIVTE